MLNLKEGVRAGSAGHLRQVRQADGDQGRQVRPVPRVQRLSGVREHARARDAGGRRRRRDRGGVRELRQADGRQARPVRQFLACTGYPECKTTRKIITTKQGITAAKPDQILDEKCPKCDSNLVLKQGRFGEFTACSNYPSCKYVKQKSTGVLCPKDGGDIVERKSRRGKVFYGCANYPDCDFTLWNRPSAGEVSGVRRAVPRREDHEAARPAVDLQQRGVLLRAVGGAGAGVKRYRYPDCGSGTRHSKRIPHSTYRIPTSSICRILNRAPRNHRRRRPGRQRSRLAGRCARRSSRAPRDAAGAADRRPQDRRPRRTGLQQLLPRRQAR